MDLEQAYKYFPTTKSCVDHLEKIIWSGKPVCPYCSNRFPSHLPKENRHHCNDCHTSFSVTVGTPFHRTRIDLQVWFVAIDVFLKENISARQFGERIGVTKDTALLIQKRLSKYPLHTLQKIITI